MLFIICNVFVIGIICVMFGVVLSVLCCASRVAYCGSYTEYVEYDMPRVVCCPLCVVHYLLRVVWV